MPVERYANLIATPSSDADDNGLVTTLAAAVVDTTGTSLTTAAAAPASLQNGQFRIRIDNEIMVVTAGQGTTTWTVTRGAEGSTAATHANGAKIRHYLTAASLLTAAVPDWQDVGNLGATETVTGAPKASKTKGVLDQACVVTVTLSANEQADLMVAQDGTGGRTATFSGVNVWATATGTAPDLSGRASGAVDRFYFENVAGTVYGYWLTEAGGGVSVEDENVSVVAAADTLDFRGSWVSVAASGAEARVNVGRTVGATSPAEAKAQTIERGFNSLTLNMLVSGRMSLVAIELLEGTVIDGIAFFSAGTALASGSNQWFTLTDSAGSRLVSTVDGGAAAWAANQKKKLAFASPYTVLASGLYYLGIVVVATTVPTLNGPGLSSSFQSEPPMVAATGDTGLTTPASWDGVTTTMSAVGNMPYAYVY